MSRRVGVAAILIVAVLILAAMATRVFEFRDVKVQRSEGRAAALDPWLAIDRVLASTAPTKRYSTADEIDFSDAGLVIVEGSEIAAVDSSVGDLAGWIERGGRLVLAWDEEAIDDTSLASFPELVPTKGEATGERLRARGSYAGKSVDVEASDSLSFSAAPDRSGFVGLSDGKATRIAIVRSGTGWALAGARPLFLENRALADPGNRAFGAMLLGEGIAGTIWLPEPSKSVIAAKSESLFERKTFLRLAGTALLLCLALLWYAAPRLGPVLPESSSDRESLLARFSAEGRFLLDRGAGGEILKRLGHSPPPRRLNGRLGEKAIMKAVAEKILESESSKKGSAQ